MSTRYHTYFECFNHQVLEPYTCVNLDSKEEEPKGTCGTRTTNVFVTNGSNESEQMKNFEAGIIALSIITGLLWIGQVTQIIASTICVPR